MQKKAQMSGAAMAIIFAFVALAVVGVVQLIGILITSKVSVNVESALPLDLNPTVNETVSTTMNVGDDNTTTLAGDGFVTASFVLSNSSSGAKHPVKDTDYKLTVFNGDGIDDSTTQVNITWLKVAYNGTTVYATYDTYDETAYHTTFDLLKSDNLDSFELGGTAQIVFAASVTILAVFGIIVMFRRG